MEFATLNTGARMSAKRPFMKLSRQVTASLIPQPLTAMNPPLAKL